LENARLFRQVQSHAAQLEEGIAARTADLTEANKQLQREILDRRLAEQELQNYRAHLEELVQARTEELLYANGRLQQEIAERKRVEVAREELLWAEHRQHLLAETLREVTLALTSQVDHNAILAEVLRQVQRIVPYQTANIALLEKSMLRVVRWQGYDNFGAESFIANMILPFEECILERRCLAQGQPVLAADSRQEPDWVIYEGTAWIRSCLIMPIQH
jgi:GAF domain-containing protein